MASKNDDGMLFLLKKMTLQIYQTTNNEKRQQDQTCHATNEGPLAESHTDTKKQRSKQHTLSFTHTLHLK